MDGRQSWPSPAPSVNKAFAPLGQDHRPATLACSDDLNQMRDGIAALVTMTATPDSLIPA
jgi:hypothetical protein